MPVLKSLLKFTLNSVRSGFLFGKVKVLSLSPSQVCCIQIKLLKSSILEKGSSRSGGSFAISGMGFFVMFAKSLIFCARSQVINQPVGVSLARCVVPIAFIPGISPNTATASSLPGSLPARGLLLALSAAPRSSGSALWRVHP